MTDLRHPPPGEDLCAYLTLYPHELTFGDDEPGAVFDRYHSPDFVLYSDGLPFDRERLLAHVKSARKRAASVHTDVHDVLVAGDRVAARYTLTAVMRKGQRIATEIFLFGELDLDGRLRRIRQLTRPHRSSDTASVASEQASGPR
jgi:SnoaL-like domain